MITPSSDLKGMPDAFAAGTQVEYLRTDLNYPADDGWTATLFVKGVSTLAPISGAASGKSFAFTITAAASSGLAPGTYAWEERATKAGKVYRMASGVVNVLQDIGTAIAGTMQSWAERCLELVEARLAGRFESDMERYTIANRSIDKIPMTELLKARSWLIGEVRAQKRPGSFGVEGVARFSEPSS